MAFGKYAVDFEQRVDYPRLRRERVERVKAQMEHPPGRLHRPQRRAAPHRRRDPPETARRMPWLAGVQPSYGSSSAGSRIERRQGRSGRRAAGPRSGAGRRVWARACARRRRRPAPLDLSVGRARPPRPHLGLYLASDEVGAHLCRPLRLRRHAHVHRAAVLLLALLPLLQRPLQPKASGPPSCSGCCRPPASSGF